MNSPSNHFEKFLAAAHRRWVAWRAIERAGMGLALGCGIAAITVILLWLLGGDALLPCMTILGIAALSGLIFGFVRRPTLLQTAMEADRQLQLDDLFSTALAMRRNDRGDGAWQSTIFALADEHASKLAPSQLVLQRLGVRVWGGIGLSAALVITLSLLTWSPAITIAGSAPEGLSHLASQAPRDRAITNRARSAQSPDVPREAESRNDSDIPSSASDKRRGAKSSLSATNQGGDGFAAARTQDSSARDHPIAPVTSSTNDPNGESAAGAFHGESAATTAGDVNGVSAPQRGPAVLPWQSPAWAPARDKALRSIQSGEIDPRYRDLVRDYFDPARH